jgi:hypothetical protein
VAFYLVLMEISHKWNQQSKSFQEIKILWQVIFF